MTLDYKNNNFNIVKFYPLDIEDNNPPDIIVEKNSSTNFKTEQIMKYNEFLISEINKRRHIVNTFKYIEWVCLIVEIVLIIIELTTGVIGVIKQDLLPTTSVACILITTITTFFKGLSKQLIKNIEKHQSLLIISESKLATVKDKYRLFILDGEINDAEYFSIVDEFKKFEQYRNDIITKFKV